MAVTEFHYFPHLPFELRHQIWRECLPPARTYLRGTQETQTSWQAQGQEVARTREATLRAYHEPPTLLQVCPEARRIASRHGQPRLLGITNGTLTLETTRRTALFTATDAALSKSHLRQILRSADSVAIPLDLFNEEAGLPFQLFEIMRASLSIPVTIIRYYWTVHTTHAQAEASGLFGADASEPWQIVGWRNSALLHLYKELENSVSGRNLYSFPLIGGTCPSFDSRFSGGPARTLEYVRLCWLECERARMEATLELPDVNDRSVPLQSLLGRGEFEVWEKEAKERMPGCELDVGVLFRLCCDEGCPERNNPYPGVLVDRERGCVKEKDLTWVEEQRLPGEARNQEAEGLAIRPV